MKEFTNPQDYSSSSQPYTHIHWNTLDTDEINMLSAPPTKSEIMKKLKKAKNTSPGKDKIEYLHLKLLDKKHYYLKQYSKLCTELEYLRVGKSARLFLYTRKPALTYLLISVQSPYFLICIRYTLGYYPTE